MVSHCSGTHSSTPPPDSDCNRDCQACDRDGKGDCDGKASCGDCNSKAGSGDCNSDGNGGGDNLRRAITESFVLETNPEKLSPG